MDLRTGYPYWLIKNGLVATYPPLAQDVQCDVAVIGAGVTGALLAQLLSEAGLNCVVLDSRDAANGSTVASTSLLQYEIDTELSPLIERIGEAHAVRAYQLGLEAIDRIRELVTRTPNDCEFEFRDSFYFASRRSHRKRIQREFECRKKHGFDVDFWNAEEIERDFPFTFAAAIRSRGDAIIDSYLFTHGLLKLAINQGASIYDRTCVTGFDRETEGFQIRTDRGPVVRARRLILATGYESQSFLNRRYGTLHSTFAAISEPMDPLPDWPGHALLWESDRPYFYLRTTPDNRVIIGGEDTHFSNDHRSNARLARKTARLVHRFESLFPGHPFEVAYQWAGTFGESDDGLAMIGEPPECPGVSFAIGFGGNGITMSVIAARILTDACLGRPNSDAAIYRFDRV